MDLSGTEECPIDNQISGGAREIKDINPHPRFLTFYLWSDFHETLYIASIVIGWVIGYEKNKLTPSQEKKRNYSPSRFITFLFMVRFS